jgi:hypothetical protein
MRMDAERVPVGAANLHCRRSERCRYPIADAAAAVRGPRTRPAYAHRDYSLHDYSPRTMETAKLQTSIQRRGMVECHREGIRTPVCCMIDLSLLNISITSQSDVSGNSVSCFFNSHMLKLVRA